MDLSELEDMRTMLNALTNKLDNHSAEQCRFYGELGSVAAKYRSEDKKAKTYVDKVERLASQVIAGFERLRSGSASRQEVFHDFATSLKEGQTNLLEPLKEVMATMREIKNSVVDLAKKSGLLASKYEGAGSFYKGILFTAAVAPIFVGMAELCNAGFLGGLPATEAAFDLARPVVSWSGNKLCRMKADEEKFRSISSQLLQVTEIIQKQNHLLGIMADIIGPYMSKMQQRAERRLAGGSPTTLTEDKIVKEATELKSLCSSFKNEHLTLYF